MSEANIEVTIHFYAETNYPSTLSELTTTVDQMLDVMKDEHAWKITPQHPMGNTVDIDIRVRK